MARKSKKAETPNEKTVAAMEETKLKSFDTVEDFFKDLQDDPTPLAEDEVLPLEETEVEMVVSSEDTKTYNFKATVFILDNHDQVNRRTHFEGCHVEYSNPVPVYGADGVLLGSANLSLEGNVLVGDFFIDYSSPERLNLETKEIPMFPHVDTHTEVVASHGGVFVGVKMFVNSILLTMYPTLDSRIGSI